MYLRFIRKIPLGRWLLGFGALICLIAAVLKGISWERNRFINLDTYPQAEAETIKQSLYFDKNFMRQLYQLLKDVSEVFETTQLTYWMDGGTLLGAVRMKGLIPWDDDLDLGILTDDIPKLLALRPILDRLGYDIVPHELVGYKIVSRTPVSLPQADGSVKVCSIYVDVLPFHREGDRFIPSPKRAQEKWAKIFWYDPSQIENRKRYAFGTFSLWGISNPEAYFVRGYGSDWNTTAYVSHTHFSKLKRRYQWTLRPEDRKPAESTGPLENRVAKLLASDTKIISKSKL